MTDELDQTDKVDAAHASNELDGFANRLAEWNSMSQGIRSSPYTVVLPQATSGHPADLANEWIRRATCRSSGLACSIRELERHLARQQEEMVEAQRLERQSAIAAVVEVMRRLGVTVADLAGQNRKAMADAPQDKVRVASPPHAPLLGRQGQIWLGHGRRPNWLKQFLAAGGQLDDLRKPRARDADIA